MDLGYGWHVLDVAEPRVSAALSMRQVYCAGFGELLTIQPGSRSNHAVPPRVSVLINFLYIYICSMKLTVCKDS
jgi:hypothetical protein